MKLQKDKSQNTVPKMMMKNGYVWNLHDNYVYTYKYIQKIDYRG